MDAFTVQEEKEDAMLDDAFRSSLTEREELEESRKTIRVLQSKIRSQIEQLAQCRKEHESFEWIQLGKRVQWCQENHLRARKFHCPDIFCRQELSDGQITPT